MASRVSTTGSESFTHEAVWTPSDPAIRVIGYHAEDTGRFSCSGTTGYTLFPLSITSANCCSPVYDEWAGAPGDTQFHGRAVGDAMWHTYKTMFAFKYLGRNGWDGLNSDAKISVEAGTADQGEFMQSPSYDAPAINCAFPMRTAPAPAALVAPPRGT
ncbi:MAG TPA: hypothetical protein VI670_08450 [Thermoanaerobaculia bacterium]